MPEAADPFRHTPELRDLVTAPERSTFRSFRPADFDPVAAAIGLPPDWRYSDAEREAALAAARARLAPGDLWVFAYGSLMWDPGFRFAEVRRARVAGYHRRFILLERGARGTPERPAVMAALDRGAGCDGLAFRIAAEGRDGELEILWRRERIGPAYLAAMVTAETALGPVPALTFVADHAADSIRPGLSQAEQVEALAGARGVLGTNLDYIAKLKTQFDALGIADAEIDRLHDAAQSRAADLASAAGKAP